MPILFFKASKTPGDHLPKSVLAFGVRLLSRSMGRSLGESSTVGVIRVRLLRFVPGL